MFSKLFFLYEDIVGWKNLSVKHIKTTPRSESHFMFFNLLFFREGGGVWLIYFPDCGMSGLVAIKHGFVIFKCQYNFTKLFLLIVLFRWLTPLEELINRINERYSDFFRRMKCAGEVVLKKNEVSINNEGDGYLSYNISPNMFVKSAIYLSVHLFAFRPIVIKIFQETFVTANLVGKLNGYYVGSSCAFFKESI